MNPWEDVVRARAQQNPSGPALLLEDRIVTYAEVAARTTDIGLQLLDRVGEQRRVVVVLLEDRAATALVTLAVQRSGSVVIALDANDPIPHLRASLAVVQPAVVIASRGTEPVARQVADGWCVLWVLPASPLDSDEPGAERGRLPALDPDWPAVLVSSSGTTARPKAVVHSHRSMFEVAAHLASTLSLTGDDRVGAVDSFTYVGVTGTTRAAFYAGAPISYYHLKNRGIVGFDEWLRTFDISFVRMQTAVLRTLNHGAHLRDTPLRTVSVVGEAIFGQDVRAFRDVFPSHARIECRYASSECHELARKMFETGEAVPDGPVRYSDLGRGVRIVDSDGATVANGEVGEVVATNPTVALGYWADAQQTEERFETSDDLRSFRTGDVARVGPDGALDLLGRNDTRVKVRGVNVELVNVEDVLRTHPEIEDCAVAVAGRPGGGNLLVAYFVPKLGCFPGAASMRAQVERSLPSANVPSRFYPSDSLPRTGSGKVDRTSLREAAVVSQRFVVRERGGSDWIATAPRDELETALSEKVQELLGLADIDVYDDFFVAGGDSLSALELVAWIRVRFGVTLGVKVILEAPTVAKLAARLRCPSAGGRRILALLADNESARGTIVLVAGAGDSSVAERRLALLIGDHHRVFGAQSGGIDNHRPAERLVTRFAKRVVVELLEADPIGPYVIGGHSFGGVVAVEIAHQLTRAGRAPESLLLLDTVPPPDRRLRTREFVHERAFGGLRSQRLAPQDLVRALRRMIMRGVRDRRAIWQSRDNARELVRQRKTHVYNVNRTAMVFAPDRSIDVPTLLIRAETGHTAGYPLEEGWRERAGQGLSVQWTPGTHATMLYEPHVFALAEVIRRWLGRTVLEGAVLEGAVLEGAVLAS